MAITFNGSTNAIGGLAVGGLPDGTVDADTLASGTSFVSYAVICDEKSNDTDGGTFTSGDWRTRDLNTEITDPDGIVSISSNQFTLGTAGTYLIEWNAPAFRCGGNQSRLYDITGSAALELGSTTNTDTGGDGDTSDSFGFTRHTITGSNTYEIQHQCAHTESTEGYGRGSDFGATRYTFVKIFKES
jgi:hypothetical protein